MEYYDDRRALEDQGSGWLLDNFKREIVLIHSGENRGVYKKDDGFVSQDKNGNLVFRNKILRKSEFTVYRNWLRFLHEFSKDRSLASNVGARCFINLDDGDCCADGIIGFKNQNGVQTAVFVPFSHYVHKELTKCTNGMIWTNI